MYRKASSFLQKFVVGTKLQIRNFESNFAYARSSGEDSEPKVRKILLECNEVKDFTKYETSPLFIVHGGDGLAGHFNTLANELNCPVYGFQTWFKYSEKDCDVPTLDSVVEEYIQEIKQIQPEGPYNVAGYGEGACVGLAMATALEHNYRDKVSNVLLLDGYCTFGLSKSSGIEPVLKSVVSMLNKSLALTEEEKKVLLNLPKMAGIERRNIIFDMFDSRLINKLEFEEDMFVNAAKNVIATTLFLLSMTDEYEPPAKFDGRVSLIKAKSSNVHTLGPSKNYNFQPYCKQPIPIFTINGDHESFLRKDIVIPELSVLVNRLLGIFTKRAECDTKIREKAEQERLDKEEEEKKKAAEQAEKEAEEEENKPSYWEN